MIARTAAGARLTLGDEIARGGEAVIRTVVGDGRLVAKVFSTDRAAMADKLQAMCDHPPPDPAGVAGHSAIAWPRAILYDEHRRLVGFVMPYVRDAVPLLDVLNPRRRAQTLPDFNRAYLHRAARNLASALAALHAGRVVVGDLNERNVLVTPRALVTLIDADSFQIQRPRPGAIVTYPCPVGRSEYTPPELQGQPFRDVVRLPEHDAFGLAVLVFQLLMGGSHPFRGAWLGEGEAPPLEEKIRRGAFPYLDRPAAPVAPPPGGPAIGTLHPGLGEAFVDAFVRGHADPRRRPSAEVWARRLEAAEAHLVTCPAGHAYADHLAACPDCGARRAGAIWALRRAAPARRLPLADRRGPTGRAPAAVAGGTTVRRAATPATPAAPTRTATLGRGVERAIRRAFAAPPAAVPATRLGRAVVASRQLGWTLRLACGAVITAAAGGAAVAVLGAEGLWRPLVGAGAPAGLRPAVVGWLAGGASLLGVSAMRAVVRGGDGGAAAPSGGTSIGRAIGDGWIGWTVGWLTAGAVAALAWAVWPAVPAPVGRQVGPAATADAALAVGWAIYGAAAGVAARADGRPGAARTAATFAIVGAAAMGVAHWLAARLG